MHYVQAAVAASIVFAARFLPPVKDWDATTAVSVAAVAVVVVWAAASLARLTLGRRLKWARELNPDDVAKRTARPVAFALVVFVAVRELT